MNWRRGTVDNEEANVIDFGDGTGEGECPGCGAFDWLTQGVNGWRCDGCLSEDARDEREDWEIAMDWPR